MKSIGIDIGAYSIKIAEIESLKEGARLTRYTELKLSQDPSKDTSIEIIDHLKTYFKTSDNEPTHFVLGLNQTNVIHRNLEFPFKERHNILKTIAFELEDEIPFSQENAIFEAKITNYTDHSAMVLATACPKYQIEKLIQSAKDYSIQPNIISVEGLALTNLFEDWTGIPKNIKAHSEETPEKRKATAYTHIGHSKTILFIYLDDGLIEMRSIPWGSKSVAHKMSRKYSIPFSEAIKEVQKKGFILLDSTGATEDQKTFSNIIKEAYHEFCQILNLALLDISSDHSIEIYQHYLLGASSQIKNIGAYFTQQTNIATNPHPFPSAKVELSTSTFNSVTGHIALGLAIEGLKKPRNPATNLLKNEFAIESNQLTLFLKKWAPTIKTSLIVFFILCVYGYLRNSFTQQMADESSQVMKMQAVELTKNDKANKITSRRANVSKINQYIKKRNNQLKQKEFFQELQKLNSALDVLKQISQNSPNKKTLGFEIKKLNIQGELVTLEGTTHKNSPLNELKNTLTLLSSNKKISEPQPTLKLSNANQKAFAYSFKVKRK